MSIFLLLALFSLLLILGTLNAIGKVLLEGESIDDWKDLARVTIPSFLNAAIWAAVLSFLFFPSIDKSIMYPNSCETKEYLVADNKPTPQAPRTWEKTKQIVVKESEAEPGSKTICRSLFFLKTIENVVKEPVPARYSLKTIENPDYIPPKPAPIYTPPAQEEYRCPVTTCCDGTCSWSRGRGTCSWHGGVCGY